MNSSLFSSFNSQSTLKKWINDKRENVYDMLLRDYIFIINRGRGTPAGVTALW